MTMKRDIILILLGFLLLIFFCYVLQGQFHRDIVYPFERR